MATSSPARRGDEGLVFEQRLEDALRHLGLVGGVGGHELRPESQTLGGGGQIVVVGAGTREAHQILAALVGGGEPLHLGEHVGFRETPRQVQAPGEA